MEFYGYKKCSTCRNAHKYLAERNHRVEFQDFVANPPSREQLQRWIELKGEGVLPFLNQKGTRFRELGLKDKSLSDGEWLNLLCADGKLLKRPVLIAGNDVVVGFDKARYDELLARL